MGTRYVLAKALLFVLQVVLITIAIWRLLRRRCARSSPSLPTCSAR